MKDVTARHSRGMENNFRLDRDQSFINNLFSSSAPFIFHTLRRPMSSTTDSSSGHSTAPPTPGTGMRRTNSRPHNFSNTYESRDGSQIVLEFADPVASPKVSPATPLAMMTQLPSGRMRPRSLSISQQSSRVAPPTMSRAMSWTGASRPSGWGRVFSGGNDSASVANTPESGPPTRLQATFEVVKKISSGLPSPRMLYTSRKTGQPVVADEEVRSPGYFDGLMEG